MVQSECLYCRMPQSHHPASYCPNFICEHNCEHNYVKAICYYCLTPKQWAAYQATCSPDEPGR
jgi:hypothetical protein